MSTTGDKPSPTGDHSGAVREAMKLAKSTWQAETDTAISSAEASQKSLQVQLDALEKEMQQAATALSSTGTISTAVSRSLSEAQESLLRTRRKLTTVRARVGRLRTFEEAKRLTAVRDPGSSSTP